MKTLDTATCKTIPTITINASGVDCIIWRHCDGWGWNTVGSFDRCYPPIGCFADYDSAVTDCRTTMAAHAAAALQ